MPSKITKKTCLGRSLVKQKNKQTLSNPSRSALHSLKTPSGGNEGILESITEQTDLAEFMTRVEMSERNYEARNLDIKVLTTQVASGVLTAAEKAEICRVQQQHVKELCIPRRPYWDEATTADELHEAERQEFTEWRMQLSKLMSIDNLTITPYEKNPQVWQQLWRVVERSDVLVQIVDARNPLLFRCHDLECYVREVDPAKVNLLLVNKSDFLTEEQREAWAEYFRRNNIYAVFFSALAAARQFEEATTGVSGTLATLPEEETDETDGDNDDEEENLNLMTESIQELSDSVEAKTNKLAEYMEDNLYINNRDTTSDVTSCNVPSMGSTTYDNKLSEDFSDSESDYESASSVPDSDISFNISGSQSLEDKFNSSFHASTSPPLKSTKECSSHSESTQSCNTSSKCLPNAKAPPELITSSHLYNREELIELLESIAPPSRLMQSHSTIGLVGYPNVGKSSTINCLMMEKKVTVSATPGKTKHFQTLHLNPSLVLCDCPGLVFPGFASTKQEMILWGILPIDRIRADYNGPVTLICNTLSATALEAAYSVPLPGGCSRPPTAEELLTAFSVTRSFMSARGRADTSRSARAILKDFTTGRLLYCTAPPGTCQRDYHACTVQPKCKNRVKLTPQQQSFMPETAADVDAHLDAVLGITTQEEERPAGRKPRKQRARKPKGHVELKEDVNGKVEAVITKPWRNVGRKSREGKKNPNSNNPYDSMLW